MSYQAPNEENLDQIYMHLTNYSLNKRNESYKFTSKASDDGGGSTSSRQQGSKRKLTKVFESMAKKGVNVSKIKSKIDDLVVKTVIALAPEMRVECAFEAVNAHPNNRSIASCFQVPV